MLHDSRFKRCNNVQLNVVLPAVRTEFRKKSIMYQGARTYNEVPDSAKHCKSLAQFKEMLGTVIMWFCCIVHFSSICLFILGKKYSHAFNFIFHIWIPVNISATEGAHPVKHKLIIIIVIIIIIIIIIQ